jgi:hypothetical protein
VNFPCQGEGIWFRVSHGLQNLKFKNQTVSQRQWHLLTPFSRLRALNDVTEKYKQQRHGFDWDRNEPVNTSRVRRNAALSQPSAGPRIPPRRPREKAAQARATATRNPPRLCAALVALARGRQSILAKQSRPPMRNAACSPGAEA